jgi:Predicted membrane protein
VFNPFRFLKFGVSGVAGFCVSEFTLWVCVRVFGYKELLAVNVVAAFLGVSAGFALNERFTLKREFVSKSGFLNTLLRLFKFQLVYALGNAVSIAIELFLFYVFRFNPVYGNVAGALVAYPVNYVVSMSYVWKVKP